LGKRTIVWRLQSFSRASCIEEFESELAWWDNRGENEQAWRVSIDQIKASNYNLDLKNPHNPDTGPGDLDHLLPEYEKLLAQVADTRAALKKELHHALTATAGTGK
jgi:type I restriction enzyme M protein